MTTKVQARFAYCQGEGTYALQFDCTGPNCKYLDGYPDAICTTDETGLHCSNGVTCSSSNYTSEVILSQPGFKVARNETIHLPDLCQELKLTSDGTAKGTNLKQRDLEGCAAKPWVDGGSSSSDEKKFSSSARVVTPVYTILFLLLVFLNIFVGEVTASVIPHHSEIVCSAEECYIHFPPVSASNDHPTTDIQLSPHHGALEVRANLKTDFIEGLTNHITAFFAGKLQNGFQFEDGRLFELYGFICSQGMYYLVNGVLRKFPNAYVQACSKVILLAFAPTGAGLLVGTLVGSTVCSYLMNMLLEAGIPTLSQTCNDSLELAKDLFGEKKAEAIFRPIGASEWFDLESDAENCGQVGWKCPAGSSCVHAACTSPTCANPSSRAKSCGAGNSGCLCVIDTFNTGYCVLDAPSCGSIIGEGAPDECKSTDDCYSGYICSSSPRCGRKICLNAGSCTGSGGFGSTSNRGNIDKTTPVASPTPSSLRPAATSTASGGQVSTSFPPAVIPALGPKSGWQLSFEKFVYFENDFSLPQAWYTVHNGKRTVNTRCISVGEVEFAPVKSFPKDTLFTFETKIEHLSLSPDTCCLALFEGTSCNPKASGVQHRLICNGVTSNRIPFETKAWMVYGCTGLWSGKPQ